MVKQTVPQTSVTPPALPQRGVAGVVGAIMAGAAVGLLAWLSLIKGADYPLLLGFILILPIPLFMTGLGIGRIDVLVAAVVSLAALAYALNPTVMCIIGAVYILPVLLLCQLALRHKYDDNGQLYWYPAGRLVAALVLYPIALYALLSFMLSGIGMEAFIFEQMKPFGLEIIKRFPDIAKNLPLTTQATPENQIAANFAIVLPGLMICSWIVVITVDAIWTQFVLLSNKNALRPIPNLEDFELPPWLLPFFAIMILLGQFFEGQVAYFARNTLLPLTVPYVVVGTSLFHLWAGQSKHKILLLVLFYMFMCFGYLMILVALAGVLEPWLHLRRRIQSRIKPST